MEAEVDKLELMNICWFKEVGKYLQQGLTRQLQNSSEKRSHQTQPSVEYLNRVKLPWILRGAPYHQKNVHRYMKLPTPMKGFVDLCPRKFQKADSDLDYIQYRLEYEIKTNHPDSAGKKNPVTLLKELSAIKSRYKMLHVRFKPIAVEQKETKSRICATFNKTVTMIQELQKQTDLELSPLTKEENTAAELLKSYMSDL